VLHLTEISENYISQCLFQKTKPFFLILLVLFSVITSSAQFIFVPKKAIKSEREWPDKHEKTALRDSLPFSNIRIVDSRYDTTDVGIDNSRYLILGAYSAAAGWKDLIKTYYRPLCLQGHDTLIIQLEKLNLQDDVERENGFIAEAGYIKALLYLGQNDSFHYIGTIDTLIQLTYSIQTNQHWDHYLLQLFDFAISTAKASGETTETDLNCRISMSEIIKSGLAKRDKPILKTDSLRFGFYRDFSEFVNNNPTFGNEHIEALNNLLVLMNYRVGKNMSTGVPDTSYWGYCDGKHIYIRYFYDFYRLDKRDDDFYLSATLDDNRVEGNRSAWNLLIGIVALTGSIASKSGPEFGGFSAIQSKSIPKIIVKSREDYVVGTRLDWETGNIGF
jgi:hypothetical protein